MTSGNQLVSIIVPVYNAQEYLSCCLDSILAQTYENLEIILVNDGSTDNSNEICDNYAKNDDRIVVIHQRNSGTMAARKAGIKICTGQYITFVDSDDLLKPNMVELLYNAMMTYNPDFVTSAIIYDFQNSQECRYIGKEGLYTPDTTSRMCTYKNMYYSNINSLSKLTPHVFAKLFKRYLVEKYFLQVPSDIRIAEDQSCVYPCAVFARSFYILSSPLYHYRQHPKSLMNTMSDNYLSSLNKSYEYLKKCYALHSEYHLLIKELNAHHAALTLRTIVKFLPIDVKKDLLMCHHFPIETLMHPKKVVICGQKDVADSYYKQLSCTKNIIVQQVVYDTSIIAQDYDVIILATTDKSAANYLFKKLTQQKHIDGDKIVYYKPKRISDMLLCDNYKYEDI